MKILSLMFEKRLCFVGSLYKKYKNSIFFQRTSRKYAQFWLIFSKNAENRMSFEIHLATITTDSLSFGQKNP